MLAEDFKINGVRKNRFEIIKKVTKDFITQRPNDRIGMVIFAGRPYILSPLTWDHGWSEARLAESKPGMVEDGTAIGSALTTSVNRLRQSTANSKVVILLTDGANNAGDIQPITAAEAAKALGIRVYTIGAGSHGLVPYPAVDPWGNKVYRQVQIDLDENLLQEIADKTKGKYFRATDTKSLQTIFTQINQLEKTSIEMPQYQVYKDLYPYLLFTALFLLFGEALLANTIFRRLP